MAYTKLEFDFTFPCLSMQDSDNSSTIAHNSANFGQKSQFNWISYEMIKY
jgi:hypothetical protein